MFVVLLAFLCNGAEWVVIGRMGCCGSSFRNDIRKSSGYINVAGTL